MTHAYRKAKQHTLMWLVVCLAGIAGQLALMAWLHASGLEKKMQAWVFVPAVVPFIAAVSFGWWRLARLNRKRVAGVAAALESAGFLISTEPKPETKASFWQSMERVMAGLSMNRGAEAVQWLALHGEEGSRMAAWEYHYTTGSGKTTQVHDFTALVWPAGHPALPPDLASLAGCQILRLDWLQRRVWCRHAIVLPDPALAALQKRWTLLGSAATATRVLTPAFVALLERSPKGECWHAGGGWVCCCFKSTLDAENMRRFRDHADAGLRALGAANR